MKRLLYIAMALVSISFISCEGPDDIDGDVTVVKELKKDSVEQPSKGYPDKNDNLPPM